MNCDVCGEKLGIFFNIELAQGHTIFMCDFCYEGKERKVDECDDESTDES